MCLVETCAAARGQKLHGSAGAMLLRVPHNVWLMPKRSSFRVYRRRVRTGTMILHAFEAPTRASASAAAFAPAVRCKTVCVRLRTSDPQQHRACRFVGVQVSSAHPPEALDDARAMDVQRGREDEAFAARFFVAAFGHGVVQSPQEPIRAVIGLGDGVGMVRM